MLIILLLIFPYFSHGYSNGGPESACKDLSPNHGFPPQPASKSPYTINLESDTIEPAHNITLILTGKVKFLGFFIVALNEDGKPEGRFYTKNQKLLNCQDGYQVEYFIPWKNIINY